ncbi:Ig-like domain-containing protein [Actinokineospora terrae]|uniref:Ig-like domain (Group 3) n=1 Tax=Actinokineospora terrae TaxID=155974 RepID=A0A1H9QUU9_9PSEU|nr:Ig-like domain-containing protein [Actinokineospora terrae]SER64252.1 Ig-like domain (group 3) [Actinokineospora terrae]
MRVRTILAAAVIAVATVGVVGTASAQAERPSGTLGGLSVNRSSGTDTTTQVYQTQSGCPQGTDVWDLTVYGPGGFSNGLRATDPTNVGLSTLGGFFAPQDRSFREIAAANGTTITAGGYTVVLTCRESFTATVLGTFTVDVEFASPIEYIVQVAEQTYTAVSAYPAARSARGTSIALSAYVYPVNATGLVTFRSNGAVVGTARVSGGRADLTTTALPVGVLALTATFTGDRPLFSGSTSSPVGHQVYPVPGIAFSVSPGNRVTPGSPVTLTATTAPLDITGSVQFFDGNTSITDPRPVTNGVVTGVTDRLTLGRHTLTARLHPNDTIFSTQVSPPIAVDVVGIADSATENISTTVLPGALLISVDNREVVLPSPVMTPDGGRLVTSGVLNPVTVIDTRAGNPGWNVSGQVSDFASGPNRINGANLGWSPRLLDKSPVQAVFPGSAVPTANAIAPGATPGSGQGLVSARSMALAAPLGGNGTARLTADLSLAVPTSTVAGTYSATLTLTAI